MDLLFSKKLRKKKTGGSEKDNSPKHKLKKINLDIISEKPEFLFNYIMTRESSEMFFQTNDYLIIVLTFR